MEATLWQRLDEIITRTVRPMAERCDEESLFCGESVRALADAGFMGLPYPPKLGGRGSSYESYLRCVERLSKACPSVGVTYATHVGLACHPLHAFGSPMQKESFLRPMLRGDKLGAFALTEPEAGSDVGAIATTAELLRHQRTQDIHHQCRQGRYLYPLRPYRRAGHGRPERLRGVQ